MTPRRSDTGRGGALEAGVIAVALAGLAFAFGVGTSIPPLSALGGWAAIGAALAVGAALAARAGRLSAGRLRPLALATVTIVGALLRFRGLDFALPFVPHPDEPAVVNIAQRMLRTGDLNPHRFVYPSLYIYLQALVYALQLGGGFAQGTYRGVGDLPETTNLITTAPGIYLWGRALTAILSTGAILLTWGAGRRLYGPRAGLLAALILAFSPSMIDDGHLITVDVPAAALTALAFYWIVALYRAPLAADGTFPWWPVARAGIGVGLAAATKYNAALIALPLLLVPALRGARAPWRVWLGGGLAAAATFFLVTPFAIPELPAFLDDTAGVITHYKFQGHPGFEGDHNWRYYAGYLWRSSGAAFPLALGGFLLMAFRGRRADLLVLPFPLLYYGALAGLRVNFTRNLMPLYPFLALGAAVALLALADGARRVGSRQSAVGSGTGRGGRNPFVIRHSSLVTLAVVPFLLAGPVAIAGQLDNLRVMPDSRAVAQRWMAAHLSHGDYWLAQLPPQLWTRERNVITTAEADFGDLTRHSPDWYPAHGFRYLLIERDPRDPATGEPDRRPEALAWYRGALDRFTLVREFPGPPGPALALLDTGLATPAMQTAPDARFGAGDGEIALSGYNLGPVARPRGPYFPDATATTPPAFRPGDWLGLTLLWRPLRAPAGDYQVFVHLRDAGGRIVAQRDTRPQNDTYPTDHWRAGEPILDSADLALPAGLPPGRYTVVLGLYPPGSPRLTARPAPGAPALPDDELTLATIEVRR